MTVFQVSFFMVFFIKLGYTFFVPEKSAPFRRHSLTFVAPEAAALAAAVVTAALTSAVL
jgi:hypothetical protein